LHLPNRCNKQTLEQYQRPKSLTSADSPNWTASTHFIRFSVSHSSLDARRVANNHSRFVALKLHFHLFQPIFLSSNVRVVHILEDKPTNERIK
jgi:hypothetical protein